MFCFFIFAVLCFLAFANCTNLIEHNLVKDNLEAQFIQSAKDSFSFDLIVFRDGDEKKKDVIRVS